MLAFLVMCAVSHDASSHVAPAVKKNNRYIKLTVFPDSVRVAYIVYFGEIPGASIRRRLDTNRDGVLSDSETQPLEDEWSKRIRESLRLSGAPPQWESVELGLGDNKASGGAFSIDLVAWACVEKRELTLLDSVKIPEAGETEILPEESPGTELTRVSIGDVENPTLTWMGDGGQLEKGLELRWEATDGATSKRCRERSKSGGIGRWLIVLVGGALAFVVVLVLSLRRARKG